MGTVIISPNLKRQSDRIDPSGNIINKITKEIIQPVQEDFVPPSPVIQPMVEQKVEVNTSKIDEMINRKIEEIVAKKIEEALSKL